VEPAERSLGALDSRSFERSGADRRLLILPVGAIEAHGPHLPLDADVVQAEATARELARHEGGLVAPTLAYGVCSAAHRFPGTITLSPPTLAALTGEVLAEFARHGTRRALVLSGHGELVHLGALRAGAQAARAAAPELRVLVLCDYDFVYERRGRDAPATDGHAGLLETSRMLHLAPDRVGPSRTAGRRRPTRFAVGPFDEEAWPESVDGDPTGASAELGARLQAHVLERLTETVAADLPAGPEGGAA
jgi:creatinine amidohydrolase